MWDLRTGPVQAGSRSTSASFSSTLQQSRSAQDRCRRMMPQRQRTSFGLQRSRSVQDRCGGRPWRQHRRVLRAAPTEPASTGRCRERACYGHRAAGNHAPTEPARTGRCRRLRRTGDHDHRQAAPTEPARTGPGAGTVDTETPEDGRQLQRSRPVRAGCRGLWPAVMAECSGRLLGLRPLWCCQCLFVPRNLPGSARLLEVPKLYGRALRLRVRGRVG